MEGRGRQPRQTLLWYSYRAIPSHRSGVPPTYGTGANFHSHSGAPRRWVEPGRSERVESETARSPSWRYGDLLRESIYNFPYVSVRTRNRVRYNHRRVAIAGARPWEVLKTWPPYFFFPVKFKTPRRRIRRKEETRGGGRERDRVRSVPCVHNVLVKFLSIAILARYFLSFFLVLSLCLVKISFFAVLFQIDFNSFVKFSLEIMDSFTGFSFLAKRIKV